MSELQLELDGVGVSLLPIKKSDFTTATPVKQKDTLLKWHKHKCAAAAGWLEIMNDKLVLMHIHTVDGPKTVQKTIGTKNRPNAAEELAFSTQELFEQLKIKTIPMQSKADTPAEGTKQSTGRSSGNSTEKNSKRHPPQRPQRKLQPSIFPFGQVISANPSSWMEMGAGAGLQLRVYNSWSISVLIAATGLRIQNPDDGKLAGGAFLPGVEMGYMRHLHPIALGGLLEILPGYYRLNMEFINKPPQTISFWDTLILGGLDFRLKVAHATWIQLIPALTVRIHTRDILRTSNHASIISTPRFNWLFRMGVQIEL